VNSWSRQLQAVALCFKLHRAHLLTPSVLPARTGATTAGMERAALARGALVEALWLQRTGVAMANSAGARLTSPLNNQQKMLCDTAGFQEFWQGNCEQHNSNCTRSGVV
jgi:hypothetical protein